MLVGNISLRQCGFCVCLVFVVITISAKITNTVIITTKTIIIMPDWLLGKCRFCVFRLKPLHITFAQNIRVYNFPSQTFLLFQNNNFLHSHAPRDFSFLS